MKLDVLFEFETKSSQLNLFSVKDVEKHLTINELIESLVSFSLFNG